MRGFVSGHVDTGCGRCPASSLSDLRVGCSWFMRFLDLKLTRVCCRHLGSIDHRGTPCDQILDGLFDALQKSCLPAQADGYWSMCLRRLIIGVVGAATMDPMMTTSVDESNALQESLLARNDDCKGIHLRMMFRRLCNTTFFRCPKLAGIRACISMSAQRSFESKLMGLVGKAHPRDASEGPAPTSSHCRMLMPVDCYNMSTVPPCLS